MEQALQNSDLSKKDASADILLKRSKSVLMSSKCSQCEYTSLRTGNLRAHLKTHSGEKSNKCNQYNYASYRGGHLKTHLKTRSGEKLNKCNQCDSESQKPRRRVGIADRKVFARPESFCAYLQNYP